MTMQRVVSQHPNAKPIKYMPALENGYDAHTRWRRAKTVKIGPLFRLSSNRAKSNLGHLALYTSPPWKIAR
eukprot:1075324-Amphidinium_carterae.1